MELFLKGFLFGLSLTIMVGPITLTILHSGLERGTIAGLAAALGTWFSDVLFIITCYVGAQALARQLEQPYVIHALGIGGGLLLFGFGIALLLWRKRPPSLEQVRPKHLIGYFFKGFAVNTLNPFSVFIWVTTTLIILPQNGGHALIWFYTGTMTSIILGDTVKAHFAHWLRKRLTFGKIRLLTCLAGGAFIAFGISLLIRLLLRT